MSGVRWIGDAIENVGAQGVVFGYAGMEKVALGIADHAQLFHDTLRGRVDGGSEGDQFGQAATPCGSDVGVFRVPGYAIVNARIGYRLFDDALELAVIGNNVASDSFRQHPFGQKISRRIFGSATLRF